MSTFKPINPMRYWCEKVLPLVYDDSLSYYEVLCKVSAKMNEVIDTVNDFGGQITPEAIKGYVDEWMAEHPEITTTVEDYSLTKVKMFPKYAESIQNPYVTPQMFDGVGDGNNDDTEAIQSAIDSGLPVYFPDGHYKVTASLTTPTNGCIRMFGGNSQTVWRSNDTTYNHCVIECRCNTLFSQGANIYMHGIGFNVPVAVAGGTTAFGNNVSGSMQNCTFTGFDSIFSALNVAHIDGCYFGNITGHFATSIVDSSITNNYIHGANPDDTIPMTGVVASTQIASSSFTGNYFDYLRSVATGGCVVTGATFSSNVFDIIYLCFDCSTITMTCTTISNNVFFRITHNSTYNTDVTRMGEPFTSSNWACFSRGCINVTIANNTLKQVDYLANWNNRYPFSGLTVQGNRGSSGTSAGNIGCLNSPSVVWNPYYSGQGSVDNGKNIYIDELDYIDVNSLPTLTSSGNHPFFPNQHVWYNNELYVNRDNTAWVKLG